MIAARNWTNGSSWRRRRSLRIAADAISPMPRSNLRMTDHPAHRVIEEFKAEHRNWLATVCAGAGVVRAELLASTLTTLLEGARVARQSAARQSPSVDFAAMAAAVVEIVPAQTFPIRRMGLERGRL